MDWIWSKADDVQSLNFSGHLSKANQVALKLVANKIEFAIGNKYQLCSVQEEQQFQFSVWTNWNPGEIQEMLDFKLNFWSTYTQSSEW